MNEWNFLCEHLTKFHLVQKHPGGDCISLTSAPEQTKIKILPKQFVKLSRNKLKPVTKE